MSMIPHNTLVVVADGRAARVFRNQGDEAGLKLHQTADMDTSDALAVAVCHLTVRRFAALAGK